MIDLESDIKMI